MLTLPERVQARISKLTDADRVTASITDGRIKFAAPLITSGKNAARVEAAKADDDEDSSEESDGIMFSGYATVFDVESEVYWGMYRMKIKRGAFKSSLASDELDARFMVNHDGLAYARTTNGTLTLEERPRGLWHQAQVADVAEMHTLAKLVERGDMNQMSFAAYIGEDDWEYCDCEPDDYCECIWTRNIVEFSQTDEVSVVTFPAIAASDVSVTRASEEPGEREVSASDAERHASAPESASTRVDASDPNGLTSLWLWATDLGVTLNESEGHS